MPAAWPGTLPQTFLVDGNQEEFGEGRRHSATDTGPGKMYRKSSAVPRPLDLSMLVDGAQLVIFASFYEVTVLGGSMPFTFPHPYGESVLARFRKDGRPSWKSLGGDNWNVNLPLEVLP